MGNLPLGVFLWTAHCGLNTQGTSLGMELPLPQVLQWVENGLDTTGVLSSWNQLVTQQPCPPYSGQPNNGFPTYGGSWIGVSCINSGWPQSGLPLSYIPLRVGGVNLALSGSSQFNNTNGRLTGTVPFEARAGDFVLNDASAMLLCRRQLE